jgi:WD40 repeat protein
LWNLDTKKEITTLNGHSDRYQRYFQPMGKLSLPPVLTHHQLWNLETKKEITTLNGHSSQVNERYFQPRWENSRFG